jgi:hypothetical protein
VKIVTPELSLTCVKAGSNCCVSEFKDRHGGTAVMGVDVAEGSIAAFVALLAAVALIGIVLYARRKGHLRSRPVLIALAVVVFALVAFGMTGGFLPLR